MRKIWQKLHMNSLKRSGRKVLRKSEKNIIKSIRSKTNKKKKDEKSNEGNYWKVTREQIKKSHIRNSFKKVIKGEITKIL